MHTLPRGTRAPGIRVVQVLCARGFPLEPHSRHPWARVSRLEPHLEATCSSALASSGTARRVLALSCQAIALSVKHCKASPSGRRTVSFCRETRRLRIVSSRGLLDRRQAGHKNLISLKLPGFSRFPWRRGRGTVPGANFSLKNIEMLTSLLFQLKITFYLQSSQSSLAEASSLLLASEFFALTWCDKVLMMI